VRFLTIGRTHNIGSTQNGCTQHIGIALKIIKLGHLIFDHIV